MATVTKAVLKTYFEQGDIPTQGQYVDLIDSQFGLGESGITQIIQGTISASSAEIEYMSFKKLYLPGLGVDDMKVGTTFIVGQTLEVSGSLNVEEGNISTNQNITASGNIEAAKYHSIGRNMFRYKSNWSASILGQKDEDTLITGSTIQLGGKLVNGTSTVTDCHVTASANFSASGAIYGNEFYNAGSYRLKDAGGTFRHVVSNGSDDLRVEVGNSNMTSGVSLIGNVTCSSNVKVANKLHIIGGGASGIDLGNGQMQTFSFIWNNGATYVTEERQFKIKMASLPFIGGNKYHVSDENIIIRNEEVTEDSVILVQQSTILNSAGTYVAFKPHNVQNQQFVLIPYSMNGVNVFNTATNNGSAIYNFKIL